MIFFNKLINVTVLRTSLYINQEEEQKIQNIQNITNGRFILRTYKEFSQKRTRKTIKWKNE